MHRPVVSDPMRGGPASKRLQANTSLLKHFDDGV